MSLLAVRYLLSFHPVKAERKSTTTNLPHLPENAKGEGKKGGGGRTSQGYPPGKQILTLLTSVRPPLNFS